MIQRYLKFTESKYNKNKDVSFTSLYQKNYSLRFRDDVCHVLDNLIDFGGSKFEYGIGYALRISSWRKNHIGDWYFIDEETINQYEGDLDSMIRDESSPEDLEGILDCIIASKNTLQFPTLIDHQADGLFWKFQDFSDRLVSSEDAFNKAKEYYEYDKLFIESLQRITRLDKNILVFQLYQGSDEFAIIFA